MTWKHLVGDGGIFHEAARLERTKDLELEDPSSSPRANHYL